MTIEDFIKWIVTSGGAIILTSWLASWVLDKFNWWKNLDSTVKSLIILGISIVIGLSATALSLHPEVMEVLKPYFIAIYSTIVAWLSTQVAYRGRASKEE